MRLDDYLFTRASEFRYRPVRADGLDEPPTIYPAEWYWTIWMRVTAWWPRWEKLDA